jgi:hypothetical protein
MNQVPESEGLCPSGKTRVRLSTARENAAC